MGISGFHYFDFWQNGIRQIATKDIDRTEKIYLKTQKSETLKLRFGNGFPKNSVYSYFRNFNDIRDCKSEKDIKFMYNMIVLLLNEVWLN